MGRSVSTHRHAIETVFLHDVIENDEDSQWAWDSFLEDLQNNVLPEIFPSLRACDRWQDSEDHVIAENGHCEISVSEYCGCVAVCLAPLDPYNAFSVGWCGHNADKFKNVLHKMFSESAMVKQGTFSNGESVYQKL